MEELKSIIAHNIADLRRRNRMTQLDLAEKLNYSDKAVSKWERGESVPDVAVLQRVAEIFHVSVDYLLQAEHEGEHAPLLSRIESKLRSHGVITGLCVLLVVAVATLAFVILTLLPQVHFPTFLCFIFACPVSLIVWLVFNSVWFNKHRNYLIISILLWVLLGTVYVSVLTLASQNLWLIFVLGIPGQAIILLWSFVRARGKSVRAAENSPAR